MTISHANPVHEVLDTRLDGLAQTIDREHHLARQSAEAMINHAVACGHALLEAKKLVPYGQWLDWSEKNIQLSQSTIGNYMRLAAYEDHLDTTSGIFANLQMIAGLPARNELVPRIPEDVKRQALELWDTGVYTKAEIARILGVAKQTIVNWIDPGYARQHRAEANERRREKTLAQQRDQATQAGHNERAVRYGTPGRAALTRATKALATAHGVDATINALHDLTAIAQAWAATLTDQDQGDQDQ